LPPAPVALDARRIDDEIRHALPDERAMHPEAITSCLVATHHRTVWRQSEPSLRANDLCRERGNVARHHRSHPRRLGRTSGEAELPGGVAEIEREQ